MAMASIQRSILLAIFGCLLFSSGPVVAVEFPDITPKSKLTDIVEYRLKDGIQALIPTSDRELFYEQYYESYDALSGINVVELLDLLGTGNQDNKTCQMCNSVIGLGKTLLQSREIVVGLLGGLCKDTDSFSRRACLGVLERMADPVIWLFKNTKLQKEEICSLLTGHECLKFLGFESDKNIFWELPLPAKKEFKPLTPPANSKNKKILHLTDIHLDLWYEAGSNASCNEPLCCRPSSEDTKGIGHITGHWSEVKGSCDTPVHFVADSLKHIARAHPDLDAIFWTGDNVPHDVWNTTQKVNLLHIHTVTKIVAEAFPNIPVFPVLGNHEAHPINLYIPQSVAEQTNGTFSMKWLYETLTNDYWSKWIDTPEAKKTFLKATTPKCCSPTGR